MTLSPKWRGRLLRSALARILIFVALTGFLVGAALLTLRALAWSPSSLAGGVLVRSCPPVVAYFVLVLLVEKRRANEFATRRIVPDGLSGFAGGTLLIGTVIGVLWLAGAYRVTGTNDGVRWLDALLGVGFGAAVTEEVVFRGVLFRIVEEGLGFRWALAISALLFGAVHLGNPGATLWSAFAIAVEAGVLLAVVFHVTRSLWACIGVHTAWNFLEGTIFGSAVSGSGGSRSLLAAEFRGPDWLTGGAFGIEASVLTVALSLAGSIGLLAARRRRAPDNGRVAVGASAC